MLFFQLGLHGLLVILGRLHSAFGNIRGLIDSFTLAELLEAIWPTGSGQEQA